MVDSVDGSNVTHACLHDCGISSRLGSRPRRFLLTGHQTGSVQVWDVMTALELFAARNAQPRASAKGEAIGAADVGSDESLLAVLDTLDIGPAYAHAHPHAHPQTHCASPPHGPAAASLPYLTQSQPSSAASLAGLAHPALLPSAAASSRTSVISLSANGTPC